MTRLMPISHPSTSIDLIPHSVSRVIFAHARARVIITLSGRNREGYGEEERVYGEIDETNRPGNFFFLSLGKVF